MSKVLSIAILLTLGSIPVFAQFQTGTSIYTYAGVFNRVMQGHPNSKDDYVDAGVFTGYVEAASDIGIASGKLDFPPTTTIGQVCTVVYQYMTAHPKEWNGVALNVVLNALKEAYPPTADSSPGAKKQ